MQQMNSTAHQDRDTDGLFDTSPAAMAARFGARTRQLLRDGLPVREAAKLAASYAFRVDTSLRLIDRDEWTTEFRGERYLTPAGRAIVHAGTRSQRVH